MKHLIRARGNWKCIPLCIVMVSVALAYGRGLDPAPVDLFSSTKMTQVELKGLRVRLGEPVQVTAQLGYQMSWPEGSTVHPTEWAPQGPYWAFTHAVPTLAKFPHGELIVTYALDPDTVDNPINISGFQISKDGGKTWGSRSTIIMEHANLIFFPQTENALLAIPGYLYQRTPGDDHNFRAAYTRFERGGDRVVIEPSAVQVLDWPKAAEIYPSRRPRESWVTGLEFEGNALKIGERLLCTGYVQSKGDKLMSSVVLSSQDGGRTWRYFSTIADPDRTLSSRSGYEGPNETTMIQLANGDLMAVFRVGSGRAWNLHRAYSSDAGHTWSKDEALPAYSVFPSMARIDNGVIALSTGRPGIRLWLSTDPRGSTWQDIDLVEHHNRWAPDPSYRISTFSTSHAAATPGAIWQTSSYTVVIELAPNRLLMVYDRCPEREPANAQDLTRVFILPIEIQRN